MKKEKKNVAAYKSRKLVMVDIENFCFKPKLDEGDIAAAKAELEIIIGIEPGDLVVIGTTHTQNTFAAMLGWRGTRQVMLPNHDGADRALIAAMNDYDLNTFGQIVIVSGDGIFTDMVNELAIQGYGAVVVTRAEAASRKLAKATPKIIYA